MVERVREQWVGESGVARGGKGKGGRGLLGRARVQYTSGTPLPTPTGIMAGSYQMVTNQGERFDVTIPAFSLDAPGARRAVN